MKQLFLGLTLICAIAIQSNAQDVVVIKQNGKDSSDKPLIVIDGVISENKNMNQIPPSDIKSINVIKGAGAAEKYGQKGEKGVVEITTKDKKGMTIDTTNMTISINGDEIMLNGEKVSASDPRLKRVKRINVLRASAPPAAPMNKAFLGVSTKATAEGALVVNLSPESPAAKAGIKENDIITKINNAAIDGPEELFEQIGKYKPEDKINIELLRVGKSIKKEVTLAKNKMPVEDIQVFNFENDNFNRNFNRDFNKNFKRGFRLPELPNLEGIDVMAKKPKLGISIEDLEEGHGVKIKAINDGSPAEKAGLKVGDIINKIDQHEVKEVNDIKWQYFEPGQSIKVGLIRNKENKIIEVKIPKKINSADL